MTCCPLRWGLFYLWTDFGGWGGDFWGWGGGYLKPLRTLFLTVLKEAYAEPKKAWGLRWFLCQWTIALPILRSHHAMLHSKTILSSPNRSPKVVLHRLFLILKPMQNLVYLIWGSTMRGQGWEDSSGIWLDTFFQKEKINNIRILEEFAILKSTIGGKRAPCLKSE